MVKRNKEPVAKKISEIKANDVFHRSYESDENANLLICDSTKAIHDGHYITICCHSLNGRKVKIHDVATDPIKAFVVVGKEADKTIKNSKE